MPSPGSSPLASGNIAGDRDDSTAGHEEHRIPPNDGVPRRSAKASTKAPTSSKISTIGTAMVMGASHIVDWFYDVIRMVATLSKGPVALVLLFYITSFLFQGILDSTFSGLSTMSPVCSVFPRFPLCASQAGAASVTASGDTTIPKRADFPSLMELQSRTLDRLLSQSSTGSQLALSVKQAELAVKDLSTLVRASNLTSKEQLASSLDDFTVEAKATGRGLQKLSAKLYSAVDSIIAFDDYAFRTLASAQAAVKASHAGTNEQVKQTLGRTFESSLNVLSSEVARVILEMTRFAGRMDSLEERLVTIHALCEHESFVTAAAWDNLLSELWTRVGGNCDKKSSLHRQLFVLENVGRFRSLAVAHIAATSEALAVIEADLSELREKLAAPSLVDDIPIEVHLASIERSARRLREEKLKVDASWDGGAHPYDRAVLIGTEVNVGGFEKGRTLYG